MGKASSALHGLADNSAATTPKVVEVLAALHLRRYTTLPCSVGRAVRNPVLGEPEQRLEEIGFPARLLKALAQLDQGGSSTEIVAVGIPGDDVQSLGCVDG